MVDIRGNLDRVRENIASACRRAGRPADDVLLIAVSKTVDVERIRQAVAAGVPALGENRVQEARGKIEALGHPVPWHLIGSLQTNKARDAVRLFDWIHSLDRADLAHALDRRAGPLGRTVDALVEVNLGEEGQKGGVRPDDLERFLAELSACSALRVGGLMAIPPSAEDPERTRPHFRRLRALRDRTGLRHLSMGMSADYEVAIEEGATMVRVGTAVFGARPTVASAGAGAAGPSGRAR
jgi:pyridoxal phosphate enzyme (YggS family)